MTPREIALSICEPWFNGDPCEGCKCHKVCTKLVERIETAIRAERAPETNFGSMAQAVDCYGDGNVYRGQRSRDSETKTITFSKVETVEPVAYIHESGFLVKTPGATLTAGTALYMSPPASQESRQVEPVAWAVITKGGNLYKAASTKESAERKAQQQIDKLGAEWECSVVPLYTAPPKREPLTPQEIQECVAEIDDARLAGPITALIRAIERAHGIGGDE